MAFWMRLAVYLIFILLCGTTRSFGSYSDGALHRYRHGSDIISAQDRFTESVEQRERITQHNHSEDDELDDDDDEFEGTYSEKEQLTAFLLSLFMGWAGAGRFYVGDYALGAVKLCLPLMVCFAICAVGLLWKPFEVANSEADAPSPSDSQQQVLQRVVVGSLCGCGYFAVMVWWFVDWVLFAVNEIPDKTNGRILYPM
mmetsp:Transcript_9902/g.15058  ORF Transcript_9902/g.15058 Transcript_9902/m.15058 type:complete len:199 (+) Transcript_9902:31-627(+)|eukprot:CAMPEP_0202701050 /NCGR_PEP_ID=MMETSP1385-20130828/14147_1 /ASSEMBLY_ACC=CAM_ASM_000861 /TAXON_ID=933848 /ORGANISM="Elphidium margaritaceum" /LENGTH=198 /DNA_ID=CAMNT_0049358359 /DNA_START=26 /DNA_END=622 /DNA_ORIENTATION=-